MAAQQPWLHELEVAVHGPVTCLSLPDGDLAAGRPDGAASGLFVDDRRVLHRLALTVDDEALVGIASASSGARTETLGVARHVGGEDRDPSVEVARHRHLHDRGFDEDVEVRNRGAAAVAVRLRFDLAGDGRRLDDVFRGVAGPHPLPVRADGTTLTWRDDRHEVVVDAPGAEASVTTEGGSLCWDLDVAAGGAAGVRIGVRATRVAATPFDAEPGSGSLGLDEVRVTAQDSRLARAAAASLDDLRHLAMRDPLAPEDLFVAAGTPWYLTLFGRDALWSARLSLPFGTDLARGTLRALARRQGTREDPASAESPGKILHEVRRSAITVSDTITLPPTYYGTVDATPLWLCTLHDAWRWGLDPDVVRELAPAMRGALGWLERAAAEGDGFLRYRDESGHGLVNQGWKDSADAMRDAAGRIADGPVALVEAQAYAVQAARGAADLSEQVLGEDGGPWRRWADDLAARVGDRFWSDVDGRRVLAMGLDGSGAPIDGLGSNIGHVLGTGTLDAAGEARVAAALGSPEMLGPFGIRTLSSANPGYNPIGYHTGSVWTHDTAICALGLSRTGHGATAGSVVRSLVDVAAACDYRWPELYGADPVLDRPAPYPASCRPQAWAAASIGAVVSTLLGIEPDVPGGRLRLAPPADPPFGAFRVDGLRLGGRPLAVAVDAHGGVTDVQAPDGVDVVVG